jgi:hypothetical protein
MVWYAGFEGTIRVFQYIDLQFQYFIIQFKMRSMRLKLEKELGLQTKNYKKFLEEYNEK